MFWITGWLRETFGLPVNKLLGLRFVGNEMLRLKGGLGGKVGKRYRAVWKHYFHDDELFFKRGKQTFELHLENEVYQALGKVRMFYVDVLTGDPVGFWDGVRVVYSPEELDSMFDTRDIKAGVDAEKGSGSINWMWIVLGGVVGAAVMFAVKDYILLPKLVLGLLGVC